jgi:hypothetical protein
MEEGTEMSDEPIKAKRNTRDLHDALVASIRKRMETLQEPVSLGQLARELRSSSQSVSHNVQIMYHKGELPPRIGLKKVGMMLMVYPNDVK